MKIFAVIVETTSNYYEYKDKHPEHDRNQISWFQQRHKKGTLLCCGPFLPADGTGLWLLQAEDFDEAKEIVSSSPRAQDGLLSPDARIVEWDIRVGKSLLAKT